MNQTTSFVYNLFLNWRTASVGVSLIVAGLVHLAFCIYHGTLSETDVTTTLMSIAGGFGFVVAADAKTSAQAHITSTEAISQLNNKVELNSQVVRVAADAALTGDTSFLKKAVEALPPADPTMLTKPAEPPKTA